MKKIASLIILLFSLFVQQVRSEPNCLKQNITVQSFGDDELSFEKNEDYNYLLGILPSAQVFFNVVPEAPVSFSSNAKTKDSFGVFLQLKTKTIFNQSFHQVSVFSRYSSAFIQIYLRTACFRL